ncbi:hypothetical protein HanRHA438_Chr01g0043651 [Helianthus annuus]|nr:hypothetical protein HanRHA438_Chr01g0043651 [Helianthus annuus]
MESWNAETTVTYGATVSYGGDEKATVDSPCFTVGELTFRGHRNLRCHRKLRWRPG